MKALKDRLPKNGLINDNEIRRAMRSRSLWLARVVVAEFILLPLMLLFLFGVAYSSGMSIWLMVVFALFAIPDAVLDLRTLSISKRWIQDEPLLGLSKKLARQKVERQRQTVISSALVLPWIIWFSYEYLKHNAPFVREDTFMWVWGIMSALWIVIGIIVVVYIYKKAQRTNEDMIQQIRSYEEA